MYHVCYFHFRRTTKAVSVLGLQGIRLSMMFRVGTENNSENLVKKTSQGEFSIDNMEIKYSNKVGRARITIHVCHTSPEGVPLHKI